MPTVDPKFLSQIRYRCIGPTRGGRVVAVAADPKRQAVFYFGAVAGGVWKSDDAGQFWENVTDGFLTTASIGALAVAPSDGNVIYAGTGESTIRIDVTHGDGVYKSTDAGVDVAAHRACTESRHIGEIRVHPDNPDLVYVAALGHASKDNPERGLYRSKDGGENWELVLHVSERAGAVDVSLDPNNPRIIFATIWQTRRTFWSIDSGGPDSGLWRSRDGGDTWENISHQPRHARRHPRQDRRVGVAGAIGSGVRDGRGRGPQARPVPLRRLRRDVGEGVVEARPRLAAVVLPARHRPPDRCRRGVRDEHEGVEVDRRRQDVRGVPHAARRQPRAVDRPGEP